MIKKPLNVIVINYFFEVLDVFSTLKHLKVILESLEVQQFTRSQSRDRKVWNPKKGPSIWKVVMRSSKNEISARPVSVLELQVHFG